MKILAATQVQYSRTKYIVELNADQLNTLCGLSLYAKIPVKDESGVDRMRDHDELARGDVVEHTVFETANTSIQTFLNERKNIENHMSQLKGAIIKLQNVLPKLLQ